MDWRIRPLVLKIKFWAQQADINDAKNYTLSSYTLTLMILHYLQCGPQPPVITSLQKRQGYTIQVDYYDLSVYSELFLYPAKVLVNSNS